MKNKNIFIFSLCIFFMGAVPLLGGPGRDRFAFNEDIYVPPDATQDNVVALGGNVTIEGKVRESVFAIGGTITIVGEVGDSVVGIGSTVTLKSTAFIRGDLVVLAGILHKEPGCRVEKDTVFFKSSELTGKFFKDGCKGLFSFALLPIILIIKFISIFIWFLLTLLVASLFPRQVALASDQIRKSFWPTFGTGLLAIILFTGLVILSALFSLLIIGIPILLSLVLAGILIKIFGRIVLFYFFGESLSRTFGRQKISPLGAALLGLLLVSLIGFIPIIGFLFSFVLSIIGWGVAIRTKFGTTENWFARK
ncbi:MAG: hypothetical protein WCC06_12465 [Candidatus Aminicenantales bacterium]